MKRLMITEFTVLGGDMRLLYMAEDLRKQGFSVKVIGFDHNENYCPARFHENLCNTLKNAKALILPVPVSRDGVTLYAPMCNETIPLKTVTDCIERDCRVFCGMGGKLSDSLFKKGVRVYDYANRDEFSVRNAVPTAEGVCEILIRELPVTVRNAKIFITGYGKTGKACAKLFSSMGARVTVAARRCSSLALAKADGHDAVYIRELHRFTGEADALINTVPSQIIGEEIISSVRRDCILIEIASAPYGIDFECAEKHGIKAINAPSLPGKSSPKTAGIIIGDTVLNILREGHE